MSESIEFDFIIWSIIVETPCVLTELESKFVFASWILTSTEAYDETSSSMTPWNRLKEASCPVGTKWTAYLEFVDPWKDHWKNKEMDKRQKACFKDTKMVDSYGSMYNHQTPRAICDRHTSDYEIR